MFNVLVGACGEQVHRNFISPPSLWPGRELRKYHDTPCGFVALQVRRSCISAHDPIAGRMDSRSPQRNVPIRTIFDCQCPRECLHTVKSQDFYKISSFFLILGIFLQFFQDAENVFAQETAYRPNKKTAALLNLSARQPRCVFNCSPRKNKPSQMTLVRLNLSMIGILKIQ